MSEWSRLEKSAREWIQSDPDPATREEMQRLVESGDVVELNDRLHARLVFGTAGLRGEVAAGPNRMNRAVVIQASRGLAEHIIESGRHGPVVVGYDARLSSREFMEDTVGVLVAAGLRVHYFDEAVPTPLVAFAGMQLDAAAAVVVTASHNPPRDNGYKVYAANGAQIVQPDDTLIAGHIETVGPAASVPRIRWAAIGGSDLCSPLDLRSVFLDYQGATTRFRADAPKRSLRVVYTPLHGVGGRFTTALLESAGHDVVAVASQFAPDGAFPTVAFPNPEEPGALDEAFAVAGRESDVDLIVANDPDADRLAVAVPGDDAWRLLTGNQIGILLADWCLDGTTPRPLVVNSVVSSPMLGDLAAARDAHWDFTLTGFKWVWNAALDLSAEGHTFVMGFEEALGYSVGGAVRDKDGMSAALSFADLTSAALAAGESVLDRLASLYAELGVWGSVQRSVRLDGAEAMSRVTPALDTIAAKPPEALAGFAVTAVTDYREGVDSRPRYLGATPLLDLGLGDKGRCLVRPSGTEPKLKIYVDLRDDVDAALPTRKVLERESELTSLAADVAEELVEFMGLQ